MALELNRHLMQMPFTVSVCITASFLGAMVFGILDAVEAQLAGDAAPLLLFGLLLEPHVCVHTSQVQQLVMSGQGKEVELV